MLSLRAIAAISADLAEPSTLLMLAALAISGTAGQLFLTRAYAAGPPGEVAVVGLSQVAFGLGFDVLLWGRRLTPATMLGIVLVLGPSGWLAQRAARRATETALRGGRPA